MQYDLFDGMQSEKAADYHPPDPPSLNGIHEIEMDFETTGVRWWDGDKPVGVAIRLPDGRRYYLPWAHAGGNLPEERIRDWFRQEVKFKHITNHSTRFEVHMARVFGVDLEEQGNTVSDVAHYAALLDDKRKRFNLDAISRHYLGMGKVQGIDLSRGAHRYHAADIAEYAMQDVHLVGELKKRLIPELEEQGLMRVKGVEDQTIYPVVECEKNGAHVDSSKLREWRDRSHAEIERLLREVSDEVGFRVEPTRNKHMERLFTHLGLDNDNYTETGKLSFKAEVLARYDHPIVKKIRRVRNLESQNDKFFDKYCEVLQPGDLLLYSLHQLRSDDGGTVTGRFASSGERHGINIQQVMTPEKQRMKFGVHPDDFIWDADIYIIRELFSAADPKHLFLSSDAMQVEYRFWAHYLNSPQLNEAYRKDPEVSFHKIVWEIFKRFKADIPYRRTKDVNFAFLFGAGVGKVGQMVGISRKEAEELCGIYKGMFPEVEQFSKKAMQAARERGWVKTILGRRARFLDEYGQLDERFIHKAPSRIIQGSATGDYMKLKMIELHAERKRTGFIMRAPVHDEVIGDIPDLEGAKMVAEILNRQSLPLRIPILWSTKTGENWAVC